MVFCAFRWFLVGATGRSFGRAARFFVRIFDARPVGRATELGEQFPSRLIARLGEAW